jgi:hypothetical protein
MNWLTESRNFYHEMLLEYRDWIHKEQMAGHGVPVDEREDNLRVLKFIAINKTETIVLNKIRAIPKEDLPLFINEDWAFEGCKEYFQERLSGVRP